MSLITRVLNGNLPLRIGAMKTLRQVSEGQSKQFISPVGAPAAHYVIGGIF